MISYKKFLVYVQDELLISHSPISLAIRIAVSLYADA